MLRKKALQITSLAVWSLSPLITLAQTTGAQNSPSSLRDIMCIFVILVLDFIPYVVVIAFGAFLMGLVRYVGNGDNEEKRAAGNKLMIYGIVGFFFMFSIWGILKLFVKSFNLPFGVPQLNADQNFTSSCPGNLNTDS